MDKSSDKAAAAHGACDDLSQIANINHNNDQQLHADANGNGTGTSYQAGGLHNNTTNSNNIVNHSPDIIIT